LCLQRTHLACNAFEPHAGVMATPIAEDLASLGEVAVGALRLALEQLQAPPGLRVEQTQVTRVPRAGLRIQL
jgi:hypothetical protein